MPIIGWLDEIAALMIAYNKMQKHITPQIEKQVAELMDNWLPEYVSFEMVE